MAKRLDTLTVSRAQILERAADLATWNPNIPRTRVHWLRVAVAQALSGELAYQLSPQGQIDRLTVEIWRLEADNRLMRSPEKVAHWHHLQAKRAALQAEVPAIALPAAA